MIYYGFVCDPTLRWIYWALQTGLTFATAIYSMRPSFRAPPLKVLRALTFGGSALSSLVPIVHAVVRYGWAVQVRRMGLVWVLVTLALNAMGTVAYACKFPEAIAPRSFDLFGASHQILHVAVICAGVTHMLGILQAFDFLHNKGNTCVIRG